MSVRLFNWFQKIYFILLLFLMTDHFYSFTDFLAFKPYIRNAVHLLTGVPISDSSRVFRAWWREIYPLSLNIAFWFILIMLILRPEILARVRKMMWNNWGIVVLLILACVSWFWSIAPNATIDGVYLVVKITLVGIYVSQAYLPDEILDMLVWVIALGSIFSILAIWLLPKQGIGWTTWGLGYVGMGGGWKGIYSFKNYLARLMGFGNVMLIFYWLKNNGAIFKRIFGFCLFILTGILLVFAYSATSLLTWLAMIGALILYSVWIKWIVHWNARTRYILIAFGIALVIAMLLNNGIIFALVNRTPTLTGRVDLWKALWGWFQKRPVLGFGYAAFWQQFPKGLLDWAKHAHSGYFEVAISLGTSGLIAFIAFLVILWKRSFSLVSQKGQIVFLWPVLALMYLTLINIAYSIAFEFPDFHWALFIIVAGVVSPSQPKPDQPISPQNQIADGGSL